MKADEAIALIRPAVDSEAPAVWADLGCGKGLFSLALDVLLHEGSTIHAVDKEAQYLPSEEAKNEIVFHRLDFGTEALPFADLDGIIMANCLHFFNDKFNLLANLKKHVKYGGTLIVVEYDLATGNPWVPYPVTFTALRELLQRLGFGDVCKIDERKSAYGSHNMYSCAAKLKGE